MKVQRAFDRDDKNNDSRQEQQAPGSFQGQFSEITGSQTRVQISDGTLQGFVVWITPELINGRLNLPRFEHIHRVPTQLLKDQQEQDQGRKQSGNHRRGAHRPEPSVTVPNIGNTPPRFIARVSEF